MRVRTDMPSHKMWGTAGHGGFAQTCRRTRRERAVAGEDGALAQVIRQVCGGFHGAMTGNPP